ncbi:hypothetical protein C171_28982 [Paenibacillus sp. FSL H8-237]|nr:hypothetical protein C171_28982 [Paenibacillus sp. FSL H8-237]
MRFLPRYRTQLQLFAHNYPILSRFAANKSYAVRNFWNTSENVRIAAIRSVHAGVTRLWDMEDMDTMII